MTDENFADVTVFQADDRMLIRFRQIDLRTYRVSGTPVTADYEPPAGMQVVANYRELRRIYVGYGLLEEAAITAPAAQAVGDFLLGGLRLLAPQVAEVLVEHNRTPWTRDMTVHGM